MQAFVIHVLYISKHSPIAKIVNICAIVLEKELIKNKAARTASIAVIVIVMPVLNAPKIRWLYEPFVLFKTLFVRRISVSTE